MSKIANFIDERLTLVDKGFAILRILTILGALVWFHSAPLSPQDKKALTIIIVSFIIYSTLLYVAILLYYQKIRVLYLVALVLDLGFVFSLVKFMGGVTSNFYLAFYILIALHSFYYGLTVGMIVALASSVLYIASDPFPFSNLHWTDLTMRILFFLLTGISLGLLSEKEKEDKIEMERLNRELQEKKTNLEEAYTNLQGTQQQLIQSEKLASLGTFVASTAHEINNPTGIIISRTEWLIMEAEEKGLEKQFIEDLRVINKHASRIADIAKGLLTFARQSDMEFSYLSIKEVIEETLTMMSPKLEGTNIQTDVKLMDNLPKIKGNANKIQQVLINIINNSISAIPGGGVMKIQGSLRNGYPGSGWKSNENFIEISIADNGAGMTEEVKRRIFDPFFTTKSTGEGTGLGMAIAYGIINDHGGKIEVKSELGKGSIFIIRLPV